MITPQKMFKGFFYTLGTGYAARLCSVGLTVLIKRQLEPSVFADVFLGCDGLYHAVQPARIRPDARAVALPGSS